MEYAKTVILKNNKECLIRNTTAEDAEEVLNIFRVTHEQTDFLSSYRDEATFDVEFEAKFLADKERNNQEVYLCAVVDSCIVGTAGIDCLGASKVNHRAVLGLAIDQTYCNIGIGRALISACIDCSKAAGYTQLELEVVSDNAIAIALYKNMGFIEFGRNPRGFYSRYQGWQELIYMRMELD